MRNYLIIIGILFVFSCNDNAVKNELASANDNALLADKVQVTHRINFENNDNPNWVENFDNKKFVETFFDKIFSNQFTDIYSGRNKNSAKFSSSDIKKRMGAGVDTTIIFNNKSKKNDTIITKKQIDLTEIKEIMFHEEWDFNKDDLTFNKKVNCWMPIRVFYRDNDVEMKDKRYQIVASFIADENSKQGYLIAEDFTSIFKFVNDQYLHFSRTGLDKKNFLKFILQSIEEGKIKSYDPIYLVDKSKREFTVDELKNYAGISLDPDEFSNEVNKIIFVEDWFFDEETFSISKKVKGIGFIADRYNDGWEEKILFFIFFE